MGRAAASSAISAVSLRFTLGPVILILVTAGSQDFVETLSLVLCLQLQLVTTMGASSIGYRALICPSDQVPDFSAGRCPLCNEHVTLSVVITGSLFRKTLPACVRSRGDSSTLTYVEGVLVCCFVNVFPL